MVMVQAVVVAIPTVEQADEVTAAQLFIAPLEETLQTFQLLAAG